MRTEILLALIASFAFRKTAAIHETTQLYEELMSGYNKLMRPVSRNADNVTVKFKVKLSQLLDVEWTDIRLTWNPHDYGGVKLLHIPADQIWVPDIVLYNNADGNYHVRVLTKTVVYSNGTVIWQPPAIYKSMCQINVEWFPFDEQFCDLQFGSLTYNGNEMSLNHLDQRLSIESSVQGNRVWVVAEGMDLGTFYPSVEWDIMAVPARVFQAKYACCPGQIYESITFVLNLRRKPLFYTIHLLVPCLCISFLTMTVFYLPSDSAEKVTLSISILVALMVFFLLVSETIPTTSLVIPLIGKYLIFTMLIVFMSIAMTIVTLNVHFRTPTTHTMPRWVRFMFLHCLPAVLCVRRPMSAKQKHVEDTSDSAYRDSRAPSPSIAAMRLMVETSFLSRLSESVSHVNLAENSSNPRRVDPFRSAVESVCYIAEQLKHRAESGQVHDDWKYMALVLDRLFLLMFGSIFLLASLLLLMQAPIFHDIRIPKA